MSKTLPVHASMTVEQTCKQQHNPLLCDAIYSIIVIGALISDTLKISNPEAYGLYAITSSSG